MVRTKTKPVFWAALICAACVYCPRSPLPPAGGTSGLTYRSLLPLRATCALECRLSSSPARAASSAGAAYRCSATVFRSYGLLPEGGVSCDSSGQLPLSIPAGLVERLYPGRLYSAAPGSFSGCIMESGAFFRFTGAWSQKRGVFEVSEAAELGWGEGLAAALFRMRALARLCFKRLLFAWGAAGGLALALLSGSREYLDPSLVESFRRAGVPHILALSGMHLSFFSSLADIFARRLVGKKHTFLPVMLAVCLFVFFAGCSPSLFRAFGCALVLSACTRLHVPRLDRRAVLGAVFLLHIALRRGDLMAPAFMLSYAAVAGILILSPPCERLLVPVLPPAVASPLAASLAAFLATAPLSLGLFGYVAPAGIVAGMAISPLAGLFLLASAAAVGLCLLFPGLSPFCAFLLNLLYCLMERVAGFFALCPPVGLG